MSKKLWSGRFQKQPHPEVDDYLASIHFDSAMVFEDLLGSLAHVSMLADCDIINANDAKVIRQGLKALAQEAFENKIKFNIQDEDIHMNIERLLSKKIGDVAGKLHTARSRNDQVAVDIHLYLRKQIIIIFKLLMQLQMTLLQLSQIHRTVILPGYTHLQRAQPIFLAQYWLAYAAMLQRDIERLKMNWQHANQSPLGACALTGTSFSTDRNLVASDLGFDGIYANTIDAVSDRDFIIEFLATCSMIMMHISRLSEELILWASQEFNFVIFDDAFSTGSSIMPQKKNPDVCELARGKTGRVYGALFTVLTILKGLPLAYNKDLQEDKEPLFDVIKTIKQTLKIYSPLLASLKINQESMLDAASNGYLNATILAEYLVKKGMTFRSAHEVVGQMVGFCITKKCRIEELDLKTLQTFSDRIADDIYDILSVENTARAYLFGNRLGINLLEDEMRVHELHLENNQQWLNEKIKMLTKVYEHFEVFLNLD